MADARDVRDELSKLDVGEQLEVLHDIADACSNHQGPDGELDQVSARKFGQEVHDLIRDAIGEPDGTAG